MTSEDIRQMNTAVEALRASNDQLMKEIKSGGSTSDLRARITRIQDQLDQLEARQSRRTINTNGFEEGRSKSEAKALFFEALRGKAVSSEDLKRKGLVLENNEQGGYLAPPEYVNEILKEEVQFSPVRQIARTRATSRSMVQFPKRKTTAAAAWTSETGTRSETQNPTFGMESIAVHELYALVSVSKQDLEDSTFDLEAFLNGEMAEQFGVSEGAAFISGSGNGKPEGLLTSNDIGSVQSSASGKFSGDDLVNLFYELKEAYLNNATWVLSRGTLRRVRTLKDGQGNYLWAPGLRADARPATILDRPYITCPDRPAVATGAKPILFGDFRRGYLIVDRLDMEVMTDPFTSKKTGMVEFSARKRVGGQVILGDAIKALEIMA